MVFQKEKNTTTQESQCVPNCGELGKPAPVAEDSQRERILYIGVNMRN